MRTKQEVGMCTEQVEETTETVAWTVVIQYELAQHEEDLHEAFGAIDALLSLVYGDDRPELGMYIEIGVIILSSDNWGEGRERFVALLRALRDDNDGVLAAVEGHDVKTLFAVDDWSLERMIQTLGSAELVPTFAVTMHDDLARD